MAHGGDLPRHLRCSGPDGVEVMGMTREKAIRLTWAQQGRVFWNCFRRGPVLSVVSLHAEDFAGPLLDEQFEHPKDVLTYVRRTFRTPSGRLAEEVVCEGHVVLGPRILIEGRWLPFECVL